MSFRSSESGAGPMTLSQIPSSPTFRASAVNAVAVIPLLSSDRNGQDDPSTYSSKSFQNLLDALNRYSKKSSPSAQSSEDNILLVVPNSSLTRPGNWKYDNTPLKNFHWEHGCQRLAFFDGRPYNSRMAHDRLINHELTRNWIDLCPHRRTAALIGVLNMRDCPDLETLKRAEQEWQQWAERYSTPPYEVTAHGRDFERDFVVQRLFVFDSFHEDNKVDLSSTSLGSSLVAFPPADGEHAEMMDMHTNVVITDLTVAVFQELEDRIRESDKTIGGSDGQPLASSAARTRFFQLTGKQEEKDEDTPQGSSANLDINNLAAVVSSENQLNTNDANRKKHPMTRPSVQAKLSNVINKGSSSEAQLLTALDDVWDYSELKPKDAQEMLRREVGRREKFAADLSLLAGSPFDAYERYLKASDLCKTNCPDPLWYAMALEGCAAAHIAMVEVGGYNVDGYLESSFQLPEEFMAVSVAAAEKTNKRTMPGVVSMLCDDALKVLSRHPKLACFHAELLLKLAWYKAEVEDTHLRCQWGLGDGCYAGDPNNDDERRWELHSATRLSFLELKNKNGEDVVKVNTLQRCQHWTRFMHKAVSTGALDPVTRADVALRCASLCLKGLRPTDKPTARVRSEDRIQFHRKASFFALAAAEALSEIDGDVPNDRASAMWVHASRMLTRQGNTMESGKYGWATLRAVALHALSMQGLRETSENAAVQLLSLMSEISPSRKKDEPGVFFSKYDTIESGDDENKMNDDSSVRSDFDATSYIAAGQSVASAARNYVAKNREKVTQARARQSNFFTGQNNATTALLAVAQSKWVDDDPIPPVLLPVADFSEIANSVIAMRSVWPAIKYENCAKAQKKIIRQISDLRKDMPASSMAQLSNEDQSASLPIKITAVEIGDSESHGALERVKLKVVKENTEGGAMATFFNPYANKSKEIEATLIPGGEERYLMVKFANSLSVPLEIPRCQLEFNAKNVEIKAPAISFVIPGQTRDFAVQFPFTFLNSENEVESQEPTTHVFDVKGIHVTCLARSFFLPLDSPADEVVKKGSDEEPNIPKPSSLYPRRNYEDKNTEASGIKSPRLEVVSAQPNLLISFAASAKTPLGDDTIIPVPLADGETFTLPKLLLTNDSGLGGFGKIEELCISATGLPGRGEIVLFDLNGSKSSNDTEKKATPTPLTLSALCQGVDGEILNQTGVCPGSSSISLQMTAGSDMGAHTKGCKVSLRFRYRGNPASSTLEVWRTREITLHVLRIKGPRISSITFRPDLTWGSGYTELCKKLSHSHEGKHKRYRSLRVDQVNLPQIGSTDDEKFVLNRLGKDPGVHICSDKIVVLVSVANETSSAISLYRPTGDIGGFEGSRIQTMKVTPGISVKIPMILPRVDRVPDICERLIEMTTLKWESQDIEAESGAEVETSGSMVPVNKRVRSGTLRMPKECLRTIVDENPTILSRLCKSPCTINVSMGVDAGDGPLKVGLGKQMDVFAQIGLADWLPADVLEKNSLSLEFCCARKGSSDDIKRNRDYVWCGQIKKSLVSKKGEAESSHRARLLFLNEGDYMVSACVSFRRNDIDDDVQEIWWAHKAQHVQVEDQPARQ